MNLLLNLIKEYGLIAMFLIIMLEYACFPVSSEIVLPFSGAVASINQTSFLVILPLSIVAGLWTGICFTIGWFGGGVILSAIKRFPKSEKGINSAYENLALMVLPPLPRPSNPTYPHLHRLVAGGKAQSCIFYCFRFWDHHLEHIANWSGLRLREKYKMVGEYYARYKHNLILYSNLFNCTNCKYCL